MERGDHLSEILDFVEVRSAVSGGSVVEGRWRTASTIDNDLKFIAVVHGSARLQVDGVPEVVELGSGDVAVLNGRSWLKIEGGQGDDEPRDVEPPDIAAALPSEPLAGDVDALIGGRIDFDPVGREFLLRTLPPLLHARAEDEAGRFLHGHVRRIFDELVDRRPGAEFAVRQHAQLLVLEIIRWLSADADLPAGWLAASTDETLRPALTAMHSRPERAWRLEELAHIASMSRTTFAERFRKAAGIPPRAYLHDWRMFVAQRALRSSDTSVETLARAAGYRSASSFSTAFKKHVGESPLNYRATMSR